MVSSNNKKEESLERSNSQTIHVGKFVSFISLKTSYNELHELLAVLKLKSRH